VSVPELVGREDADRVAEQLFSATEERRDVPPEFERIEPVG